nr:MAG TPA: Protein of unknown function (DUF2375) [Caudoviricetes sp.]
MWMNHRFKQHKSIIAVDAVRRTAVARVISL